MSFSIKTIIAGGVIAVVSTAAVAADLPSRKAPVYAPVAAPMFTWTGFYVGANLGYGFNHSDRVGVFDPAYLGNIGKADSKGLLGGLQAGYNWQAGAMVYGLEGDFNWTGMKKSVGGVVPGYGATAKIPMFATLRVRLGYAMGNALLYATGGLAVSDVKYRLVDFGTATATSHDNWRASWTLGGGLEYAFNNNWSAKVEYLYVHAGKHSIGNSALSYVTKETQGFHTVRAGLNYKFGGPSAIVAKY